MRKKHFRTLAAVAVALLVPLAVAGLASVANATGARHVATPTAASSPAAGSNQGKFESVCFYSHSASDDPIIYPNQPGASPHAHDFLGNPSTNANSTVASLQAAGTNCVNTKDFAAYWVPTLLVNPTFPAGGGLPTGGTALHPSSVTVYYLSNGKNNTKPFPLGLHLITGNAHATSPAQESHVYWGCSTTFPTAPTAPTCPSGSELHVRVDFADCWNGTSLDSPDHVSHVAYSDGKGNCPAGFPVPVPQLSILVKYPNPGTSNFALSSGLTYTMHGDFINAWDTAEMAKLTSVCLDAGVKCNRDTSF
jgi:hypothetical protein